jgi:hypothetical protein
MRVMTIAVFAAFAVGAISSADAAPRKSKRQYVQAAPAYVPVSTYVMHRDEQGRTQTKILVQKRSYLDGGTEVMPGDISGTNRDNLINSFSYNPSRASVSNDNVWPTRPIPDPFFLPGKNNPFFY